MSLSTLNRNHTISKTQQTQETVGAPSGSAINNDSPSLLDRRS